MKIDNTGYEFLKEEEGARNKLYDDLTGETILHATDATGEATIGIGHLVSDDSFDGITISESQIKDLFLSDVTWAEDAVNDGVVVPLTQNQFNAMVSIVFNVGTGKAGVSDGIICLASGEPSTLLKHLNSGDYVGAADHFVDWKYAGGEPILEQRRLREADLFETPE